MKRTIAILAFVLLLVAAPATMQAKTKAVEKTTSASDSAASNDNRIFYSVEQPPQYPGGDAQLLKDVQANLKYPAGIRVDGRVVVQFRVNKTGAIDSVKVVRSLGAQCDSAAVKAIRNLPHQFTPGRQYGHNVDVWYTMPVTFKSRNDIFHVVEQMPSYPGGNEQLMRDLCDKLIIPPSAADLCYEGRCIIQFVVTKTGEVGECKVVRSLFDIYDQAVINAIKRLPQKFIPGRKDGQPVNVWYILPVSYRMQKDAPATPQEK